MEFGAEDEVRTRDIQLGKLTLYQLSYSRIKSAQYNDYTSLLSNGNLIFQPTFSLGG